jgi:cytidylate kinase
MIIVIDGPSGTGKSTVAKAVAKKLGFAFFDTGAMYRSFAWYVLERGVDPAAEKEVETLLPSFEYEIRIDSSGISQYFVQKQEVTKVIREPKIAAAASQVAAYPEVRKTRSLKEEIWELSYFRTPI